MAVAHTESKRPTLVIVLKAKDGAPAETVRLPGVELRHAPERGRVIIHRNGREIACLSTDELESWSVESE